MADIPRCLKAGAEVNAGLKADLHPLRAAEKSKTSRQEKNLVKGGGQLQRADYPSHLPLPRTRWIHNPGNQVAWLQAGANPNARDKGYGWTPLHWAGENKIPNGCEGLGESWSRQRKKCRRNTPLHNRGSVQKIPAVVKVLHKAAGCQSERGKSQDKKGATPLHKAAFSGTPVIVTADLLKAGTDPNTRDTERMAVIHYM